SVHFEHRQLNRSTRRVEMASGRREQQDVNSISKRHHSVPHTKHTSQAAIAFGAAIVTAVVVLTLPLSAPRAEADCSSLNIKIKDPSEFTNAKCDQGILRNGDISGPDEVISAQNGQSVFSILHVTAGPHTYIKERDPKTVIQSDLKKSDNWSTAPGGKGFAVV